MRRAGQFGDEGLESLQVGRDAFEDEIDLARQHPAFAHQRLPAHEGLESGERDHGIWSAGQVQGLIEDVPTVKVLVDRIVDEAEAIIREKLAGVLAGR